MKWVRPCSRPLSIRRSRARGAKAHGVRYEKAFAERVRDSVHGQWFEWQDGSGKHWCQTDLLFRRQGALVVAECKYSWTLEGFQQLEGLYLPLLRALAPELEVLGFQVCRRLLSEVKGITVVGDIPSALAACRAGKRWVTLHWLGKSALEPLLAEGPTSPMPAIAPAALGL